MCGIWALFGIETNVAVHGNCVFTKIAHRGPDAWRLEADCRLVVSDVILSKGTLIPSQFGIIICNLLPLIFDFAALMSWISSSEGCR